MQCTEVELMSCNLRRGQIIWFIRRILGAVGRLTNNVSVSVSDGWIMWDRSYTLAQNIILIVVPSAPEPTSTTRPDGGRCVGQSGSRGDQCLRRGIIKQNLADRCLTAEVIYWGPCLILRVWCNRDPPISLPKFPIVSSLRFSHRAYSSSS